jgi:hypothetical protein
MTEEELRKITRQSAAELLRPMFHSQLDVARIESALNIEWWHGYYAAKIAALTPPQGDQKSTQKTKTAG